jgi:SAM-dependent methyltransferase
MTRTIVDRLIPGRRDRIGGQFDRRHGVETEGRVRSDRLLGMPAPLRRHAGEYQPTNPALFRRIVRKSRVNPEHFTFLDLGCGKGRALIAAADYPFDRIVGVEADSALYRIADDNLDRWRRERADGRVTLIHGDARTFDLPAGNLFVFMYSPFLGPVFQSVAERLAAAAAESGRAVVIAYSSDREGDALERTGLFKRVRLRRRQFWAPPSVSYFYNDAAHALRRQRGGNLARLYRLNRGSRRLVVRATLALAGASAAIAFLPFRRSIAFGSVRLRRPRPAANVEQCVWAVEAAARRVPWRAKCIEQGLAVQRLLRQSGTDALLHYGARRESASGEVKAHVWVTVAGEAVIGGEEAVGYREIATFP